MNARSGPGRMCREVQSHLGAYRDGSLPRWRRKVVDLHLRRCGDCRWALKAERSVAAGLERLSSAAEQTVDAPPEGLLESLLSHADHPDLRARAAVPVRGAVSGARPGLSAVLLLAGAVTGTAVGYAGWRGARAISARLPCRRTASRGSRD